MKQGLLAFQYEQEKGSTGMGHVPSSGVRVRHRVAVV